MTRPCTCERSRPGEPFDAERDCWKCWHWHHHPGLRAAWGGRAADVTPVRAALPPARPLPVLREWTPCRHEGDVLEACQTCGPKGHRHVRECDLHGRCTREVIRPSVRACRTCTDYRPDPTLLPTPAVATAREAEPAVLFASHYLERDGAPVILVNLVTRLRHCRPTVFSWHDGPLRRVFEDAGVRVVVGDRPDLTDFDLLVANTIVAAPAVEAALAAGVPVVWLVHEYSPSWLPDLGPTLARLMPRVAATVFPSEQVRGEWAAFRPANPQVVPTHPPPVPVRDRAAERARLGWGEEYVVLSLGRDEPRKGQSDIREAVADLSGVRLVTAAGHADPHALYAAADLYVCSSRAEAFCMATQEAEAHGLPIVSTPAGLLSGAAGDVYQPGDVAALRALIGRHRDRPHRGERRPRPGYHRTLTQYEDLFRAACQRPPVTDVRVVYHVAGLGPLWRDIAREQLGQLRAAGLTSVLGTFVGDGLRDLIGLARAEGVELTVAHASPDVQEYERPGIRQVYRLALAGDAPVLYLHSKGVSRTLPDEAFNHDWRRLMMRETVGDWRVHAADLAAGRYDAAGVNWWFLPDADGRPQGHFSGNFWMASAAWLRGLPDPDRHYRDRWSCERWVGSVPGCRAKSLVCSDRKFWAEDQGLLAELLRG